MNIPISSPVCSSEVPFTTVSLVKIWPFEYAFSKILVVSGVLASIRYSPIRPPLMPAPFTSMLFLAKTLVKYVLCA